MTLGFLALRQLSILRLPVLLPIHLPTFLCSTPVTALPSSYEGSVSRLPFTRAAGYPRFTTTELSCRSVSNHPMTFRVRFLRAHSFRVPDSSPRGLFPSAPFGSLGFASRKQARHFARPTRVSDRTDRQTRQTVALHLAFERRSYGPAFNQLSVW